LIANSHAARRELRRIAVRKEAGELCGGDDGAGEAVGGGGRPYVSGIFIHPVKSLRPVSLSETAFDEHGLVGDRRLMVVRPNPTPLHGGGFGEGEATHRFLTQRQAPGLATIEAAVPVEVAGGSSTAGGPSKETKRLIKLSSSSIPNDGGVFVDVHPSSVEALPVRYLAGLWGDVVEVADCGDEAAEFVAKIVGRDDSRFEDARLVSIVNSSVRKVNELYCPDAARVGPWATAPQGGLTDGFPILVATQASLNELNTRLEKKAKERLPMSRFRPNIVIDETSQPFDEDEWKAIQIGKGPDSVILHVVKGCPRCKQSCTDQLTGERGEEPLETLSEFRALGADGTDVYFAQNAVLDGDATSYGGRIRVGDPVTVLTRGGPVWDSETVQAE